jgi:transposase
MASSQQLLQMASEHTLHMQKALSQMNLQIHHVLSDITGVSGQAILDAVLAGERDPMRLAKLCHVLVKTPHETVAKGSSATIGPSTCSLSSSLWRATAFIGD